MSNKFIPFHVPSIGAEELREVEATLRSGWLTTGPRTAQFEKEFKNYVGAPHAVAVNSGTAGLHVALAALGIGEGDEVILPSFTFLAVANAVLYQRGRPVFVDIDPVTLNLTPEAVERAMAR